MKCLTVALVGEAQRSGFEAYHVAHIGKAGRADWSVVAFALPRDLILVSNNARDFRKLHGRQSLHPGLIILVPNVTQDRQILLFRAALTFLRRHESLVNQVLEVGLRGDEVTLRIDELSDLE